MKSPSRSDDVNFDSNNGKVNDVKCLVRSTQNALQTRRCNNVPI